MKLVEFFTDEKGQASMSRLLCFMTFFPATYVVMKTLSDNALGWYLGAYVLGYVGGKASDAVRLRGNPQ